MPAPDGDDGATVLDLAPSSIVAFFAGFALLVAATGFVRSIPRTTEAVAIGGLLALALDPVVSLVERRLAVRRAVAVAVVVSVLFSALLLVVVALVPPAIRQARQLPAEVPQVAGRLGELPLVGPRLVAAGAPAKLESALRDLPHRLAGDASPVADLSLALLDGALIASATLLLAATLLVDGQRLLGELRRLVPPDRRAQADRLARLAQQVVGRYVAGSLSVAGLAGLVNLVAGLALGVPLAPLAALNVTLWNLVPQVGGLFGAVPFVVLGFSRGPSTGIACLVVFLTYQNIENHLVQPLLIGSAVKLSPPTTMVAALIGVAAGGVVGALLVIPLLGAVKAIVLELRPPGPRRDDDGLDTPLASGP